MFKIHIDNHFKIWFSNNKDVFLDFENKLRLAQTRKNNPAIKIHLIYSSQWLSEKAKEELARFCRVHNIIPVDFDTDLKKLIHSQNDKELYELAKKEIQFACEKKGGNLGAASDCTRVIIAVLEKYGIYTDFDVEINVSKKRRIVNSKAPVLIQTKQIEESDFPVLNTDTIAAARDPNNEQKLCEEAILRITHIQEEIIKRYANPKAALFENPIKFATTKAQRDPSMARIIQHYFNTHPKATIFEFRKYIENFSIVDFMESMDLKLRREVFGKTSARNLKQDEAMAIRSLSCYLIKSNMPNHPDLETFLQNLDHGNIVENALATQRHLVGMELVCAISGPVTLGALYKDLIGNGELSHRKISQLIKSFADAGVEENIGKNTFYSDNDIDTRMERIKGKQITSTLDFVGIAADQSWTKVGAQKKQERIQELAAGVIQYAWQQHRKNKANQKESQPEITTQAKKRSKIIK